MTLWVDQYLRLSYSNCASTPGKTELAKQIANYLYGGEKSKTHFIRIDMSEYQEKHEVS